MLTATTLPLVGTTLRTRGSELPSNALVVVVTGLQLLLPAQALSALFPQAPTGCDLHVVPDLLSLSLASNGIATEALAVPNLPQFAGLSWWQQMVPIELGPAGNIMSVTATNTLQLQIGIF